MLDAGTRLVVERALPPAPALGLGAPQTRTVTPDDDPVAKPDLERAKTVRFNLAATPPIGLAARAYTHALRLPPTERAYPTLIARTAIQEAIAAAPETLRSLGYAAHIAAERAVRRGGADDPALEREARRLRDAAGASAFFARQFLDAAEANAAVEIERGGPRGPAWRAWTVAVSRFAAGERDADDSQIAADVLSDDEVAVARVFALFVEALSLADRAVFPDAAAWIAAARAVIRDGALSPQARLRVDDDLFRVLETIGRPDMAPPLIMARLNAFAGSTVERAYLHKLGAFVRALCYLASVDLLAYGAWTRVASLGYDPLTDFLDSEDENGELIAPGVVARPTPGVVPYPALSPEADCTIMRVASGVCDGLARGAQPTMSADFEAWAEEAAQRTAPPPSLARYLKLVYVDLIYAAFERLRGVTDGPIRWRYAPLGASALAAPTEAITVRDGVAAPERQQRLLEVMIEVRRFLQDRYG